MRRRKQTAAVPGELCEARYVVVEGHIWRLGDPFLVEAFFKTVAAVEQRASDKSFPALCRLEKQKIKASEASRLRSEIAAAKEEFLRLPARRLVWSFSGPAPRRPWSIGKSNLALCFAPEAAPDLFLSLELAAAYAADHGQSLEIV